ncbi:CaiB/BaiF CoA transferase family protein [Halomicrobium urmianum]|uniref:CaiB/BaiF CoA transferase family protein n=1 Tax=Halomicrobium urmianum TaxID=1586233 RepID=UPI001CD97A02|nr:CaiB/BaiF CoA-transferase family protein [Halomicrobium urmianum]
MQSLEDVTIADFTQLMAGGWSTQKLGDMGADVIKIERPSGDVQREMSYRGRLLDGEGIGFLTMNRNKRSVALDLKTDEGHRAAMKIVESADVLVHNYRPGVMDRLDLSYDDVAEVNPEIVYVEITGYGSSGPYSDRPGQDLIYQAMTGLTSYTGRADDPPTPAGTVVVDEHTATLAALHTLQALYHRERTGTGQKVETSLLNAAVDLQCNELTFALNVGEDLPRGKKTHGHPYLYPPYGVYETSDGYVAIGMSPIDDIADAFELDGLDEYDPQEELFENRDGIHDQIEEHTRKHEAETVVESLVEADVQASEVRRPTEVESNPQVQHNELILEIDRPDGDDFKTTGFPAEMSEADQTVDHTPPAIGRHTREVLRELGYGDDEVDAMLEQDAIAVHDDDQPDGRE